MDRSSSLRLALWVATALLGWPTASEAFVATVRWTHPSPSLVTGFRVYLRLPGQSYAAPAYDGLPVPVNGTYAVQLNLPDSGASYLSGSSYGPGGESVLSNEVPVTPPAPICGNGVRQGAEACDDGNLTNGDGCRANCTVEACGDRIVDPPAEQCDDGNTTNGDGCESCRTARIPACGDGFRDPGEACDDGNLSAGDGCRANCTAEVCGDRVVDPPAEQCDDGNTTSGDGCESCRLVAAPACGNGTREAGEACDDGNRTSGDGCRSNCSVEICGDRIVDPPVEQCDDGNATSGDGCESCQSVRVPACGDGFRDAGEACDDGNRTSGDGCRSNCSVEICGDRIVDPPVEQCDDGNATSGDGCESCQSVRVPACGDGFRDAGEACDDGNRTNGDGCRSNCTAEICGDRVVDPPVEQCDDGNTANGDGCESCRTARIPACGDGNRDPGEACDDGNLANGDGCRANCTVEVCGDGLRDPGEACDDGNAASGDGCDAGCIVSACGNGVLAGGEGCDDGNTTSGDGCDANCTPTGCGNGAVGSGETCDDGNPTSGDGCDANCTPTACGNGVATEGETCDDGNLEDGDGCSAACELQEAPQTDAQVRCIVAVNRGVARIARMQIRHERRCLDQAIRGKLGTMPTVFDACLEADLQGDVAEAEKTLDVRESETCVPDELPTLALGDDRLSGLPYASDLPTTLVRDVFGAPAVTSTLVEAPPDAQCQREVLRGTTALFDAIWRELPGAQEDKLRGRRHTEPATNDEALGGHLEEALAASAVLARKTDRLVQRTIVACTETELAALFPGCDPEHALGLAACAVETTRCRACQLLLETNPRLDVDCDAFDDWRANGSCPSPSGS